MLINMWPTNDLSVRTEVGRKSTTKCIEKSESWFMVRVRCEPTIPVSERSKTLRDNCDRGYYLNKKETPPPPHFLGSISVTIITVPMSGTEMAAGRPKLFN
jgi:hypothetical protein